MAVATSPARPRASSNRIIIAGAVLAALAFVLVIFLGSRGIGGGAGGTQIPIVVAARDIGFRTALTKDDLTVKNWPSDLAPPGYYSRVEDVIGKSAAGASAGANDTGAVAEVPIKAGQPITQNLLAKSIDAVQVLPAYLPIPKGFVAITVPTSEQMGVAGYVQAGDYINVIATTDVSIFGGGGQQGPPKYVARTVFTNVHVLKVGPATGQVSPVGGQAQPASASTGGVASSLTLVMTECDAEYLKWLLGKTQLSYTLGSYQDYKPTDTRPDPSCADATAAHGVDTAAVNNRWHFTG